MTWGSQVCVPFLFCSVLTELQNVSNRSRLLLSEIEQRCVGRSVFRPELHVQFWSYNMNQNQICPTTQFFFRILSSSFVDKACGRAHGHPSHYAFILCTLYKEHTPVTVAVRSEAWVLAGWLLGSWVRIPLKAWMFVPCLSVLCVSCVGRGLATG
jgi:hypothetical protein